MLAEPIAKFDWSEHVRSVMTSDEDIILSIIKLHNKGKDFEVDPTYSKGVFWRNLEPPKLKFDILPQVEGVIQASADRLPIESNSVGSVMFDPPFVIRDSKKPHTGIIANRFSAFKSIPELWGFYDRALNEFWRILYKGGIVAFKCQDTISGGVQYMSHYEVMKSAERVGYYMKDLMILHRKSVLFSPNMKIQQHARKTHSYYLVLEKK